MNIRSFVPMKFDVTQAGLVALPDSARVTKQYVAKDKLTALVQGGGAAAHGTCVAAEMATHRQSISRATAKVERMQRWQTRLSWGAGATGSMLGVLSLAVLAKPFYMVGAGALVMVPGYHAVIAAVAVLAAVAITLLLVKVVLAASVARTQGRIADTEAYIARLEREVA